MTRLLTTYCIAVMILLPAIAHADTGRDAIEAHYRHYNNVGGQNFDGFSIKAALQLPADFYVFGAFTLLSANSNIDQTMILGGVGRGYQKSPVTRLYGGLSYERVEIEIPSPLTRFSAKGQGVGVRGGARHTLTPQVELKGEVRYLNLRGGIDDDYFGVNVGTRLLVTPQVDLIAEYDNIDGDHGLIIGLRYSF